MDNLPVGNPPQQNSQPFVPPVVSQPASMRVVPPVTPPASPVFGPNPMLNPPSTHQQSIGTIASIIIIVLMIVIGAFYAWGKKIAEERGLNTVPTVNTY